MGKLNLYLPPFASDYTGVCSALFDLDCLTVVMDASCCTSHVVYWDEPRWAGYPRPTVSAQLRSIDCILGNDDCLVDSIAAMQADIGASLLALVGTPVPSITGMDLEGLAFELEGRCGVPALGFSTGGFSSYEQGLWQAGSALVDRFAAGEQQHPAHKINLLGLSPLDHGNCGNESDLRGALENAGWQLGASLFHGLDLQDLAGMGGAEINLALSATGVRLAEKLRRTFGTAYVAACPMGTVHLAYVLSLLSGKTPLPSLAQKPSHSTLIVMDQVMGCSLRQALRLAGCGGEIHVGSFFYQTDALALPGDLRFSSEAAFLRYLRQHPGITVIGDPLLEAALQAENHPFYPFAHPAVSGKLHWQDVPRFLSPEFDHWLMELAAILQGSRFDLSL